TDSSGTPVDGATQITFQLYTTGSGGASWFSETQVVQVDQGELTVYLGSIASLDLSGFAGGTAFLGITIQGESEMLPRLEIGTVPYAAYAQETAAVPSG